YLIRRIFLCIFNCHMVGIGVCLTNTRYGATSLKRDEKDGRPRETLSTIDGTTEKQPKNARVLLANLAAGFCPQAYSVKVGAHRNPALMSTRRFAMSLKPSPIQAVPDATVRVVCAVFPKRNPYLTLREV